MPSWFRRRDKTPPDDAPLAPPTIPALNMPPGADAGQTIYVTGDRKRDTDRIKLLVESLGEVSSASDPRELLVRMVDRAIVTVQAERGLLFLSGKDEDGKPILRTARSSDGRDLPPQAAWSTRVVEDTLEKVEAVCLKLDEGGDFDPSQSMLSLNIRAVMCVPLVHQDQCMGALYVDSQASARNFDRGDLRFFQAFAEMLSIVWANRNALEERLAGERMRQDLELAQEIQAALVPAEPLRVAGYSMVGRVQPATETGGDYFDFFITRGDRIAMVVGDVSGHGMGSALLMSGARAYVRGFCQQENSPATILRRVNRHLAQDTADHMFMSMFLCVLDPSTGDFHYSNAGHPNPILYHADTGELEDYHVTGFALGIEDEAEFGERGPFRLNKGDTVIMFSDGLTELRDGDELFGRDRIRASVLEHIGGTAPELLAGLFADAEKYSDQLADHADDVTIAVLRFNGTD